MSDSSNTQNPGRSFRGAQQQHVAVIGGGLVGASAALGLASLGIEVTLVDRQAPSINKGELGVDLRTVALSCASQTLLSNLGVWSDLASTAYRRMVVWEQWGTSEITFDAQQIQRDELGWIVEVSPTLVQLWERLDASAEVTLLIGEITDVEVRDHNAVIVVGEQTLEVDFVIAADGANSAVRRAVGIESEVYPTGQVALASTVRTEHAHQFTAWQRFDVDGPIALLPCRDEHICSLIWSQSEQAAQARVTSDASAFCRELTAHTEARLGQIEQVDRRIVFPLLQQLAQQLAQQGPLTRATNRRVLLIGDALRVLHPLAGMGVNIGLEDVACVLENAARGVPMATEGLWQKFRRQREARSRLMIHTMDWFKRIYCNDHPGVGWLRNVGVKLVDQTEMIKRQIMREAMGLDSG